MKVESSITVTATAIDKLRREALAAEITETNLAPKLGMTRQTLASKYKKGDMKLSEFIAAAHLIGTNPINILTSALADCKEESDG
ncbi:MAG: hypothetical protein ACFNZJ_04175 [Parascardovia denticolens]